MHRNIPEKNQMSLFTFRSLMLDGKDVSGKELTRPIRKLPA